VRLIEWIISRVDLAIEKHGLVRKDLGIPMFPDLKYESAVETAKRLNTFNKIDRSAQYPPVRDRYLPEQLLKNDNVAFAKIREIERLHFWHAVAILILSTILGNAAAIYHWILTLR
jgi:hypothetical protein